MKISALVLATLTVASLHALAQTNASKASAVGTWKVDIGKSHFGSDPAPKDVTLTILEDTADKSSWRVDVTDDKGQSMSYSWNAPKDGSLHPIKGAKGETVGQEGLKVDKDGALLRHGVDESDGTSFEARAVMSPDGNTITDVVTTKSKDGKTSNATMVYHRVKPAK
jgi:hypothetical protein